MYYSHINIPTFCVPVQIIRTQQFLPLRILWQYYNLCPGWLGFQRWFPVPAPWRLLCPEPESRAFLRVLQQVVELQLLRRLSPPGAPAEGGVTYISKAQNLLFHRRNSIKSERNRPQLLRTVKGGRVLSGKFDCFRFCK